MAKGKAEETKAAGVALVENAGVSTAATENATTDQTGGAGTSAKSDEPKRDGPRERLEGPVCPNCKETDTRVTKVVKLEDDRAYPSFMGVKKKVRYYKCSGCGHNFKA